MSSMKKETVTVTTPEQKRVLIVNQVQTGHLSAAQAAALLQISDRHMRRILAAYRKEEVAALAHGNAIQIWWNATFV